MISGVAIRYSDELQEPKVNTIEEHNAVFNRVGRVFVGKFGQPLGDSHISDCNETKAWNLILVKKDKPGQYSAWKARIQSVQKYRPDPDQFPKYYSARSDVRIWFELAEPFSPLEKTEMLKWVTKSSNQPLINSLMYSMSGLFYVKYDPDSKATISPYVKKSGPKSHRTKSSLKKSGNTDPRFDNDFASIEDLDGFLWGD